MIGMMRVWVPVALVVVLGAACELVAGVRSDLEPYPAGAGGAGGSGSTMSGTTSASGGAGAGGCMPGEKVPCYTGPAGTEGVGQCKAGTQTCGPDGKPQGMCAGEVLPGIEDYGNLDDEDCDGLAGATTVWAQRFGDIGADIGWSVAVDASGNALAAGQFEGGIQLGNDTLSSAGDLDVYVAKLDPNGAPLWGTSFGSSGIEIGYAVAADAAGNVAVTGKASGGSTFGCGPSANNLWVGVLDPSGQCSTFIGCQASATITSGGVSLDPAGNIIVAGLSTGNITCGSNMWIAPNNSADIFVAKFAPDGTNLWLNVWGDGALQGAGSVAVDDGGNVFVTGVMYGVLLGMTDVGGNGSAFLLKLNPSGSFQWIKVFPNSIGKSIALTSTAGVVITGVLKGSADFGDGTPLASAGAGDIFVAKFGALGNHLWSRRFGDTADQGGTAVAVDQNDNVTVAGYFAGTLDLDGPLLLPSTGVSDAFVASFDPDGNHRWSRSYGGSGTTIAQSVAAGPKGEIVITGGFDSPVDFGTGVLTPSGGNDVFIMKVAP